MKKMMHKELKLATSPMAWIFLLGAFMTLLPGYPILMGAFFICFGIFQSFQQSRENNDTLYSVLLPVPKTDFVKSKYMAAILFQMIGFIIAALLTVLRMTALSESPAYTGNALMNASPVFLAFMLLIFTAFNLLFVGGFFKTAYKIGMPFLSFGIAVFAIISAAEILHHIPPLRFLNTPSGEKLGIQFAVLAASTAVYIIVTLLSLKCSMNRFEKTDL